MREIEIKARCVHRKKLLQTLTEQGIDISEPVTQNDQVFGLPGEKGDDSNQAPWLRIRTEKRCDEQKIILTLKKSVTGQLDSIEHETEISDAAEAQNIILHLGFEPYVSVAKTRRKATIGDIELCIDEVEGLGSFVEAEKLTDDTADYDEVMKELWTTFERFGIAKDDEVLDGYDVLLKKERL